MSLLYSMIWHAPSDARESAALPARDGLVMQETTATRSCRPPPSRLDRARFKALTKVLCREARSDDLPGVAAEVTYHGLFAIPATLIVFAALAALVNLVTDFPISDHLRTIIVRSAPGEARILLASMVEDAVTRFGTRGASLGFLSASAIALWSGSNGVLALIKAFNRAYDVNETRPHLGMRLKAIGLTLLGVVMITTAFALFVFGHDLGAWLVDSINLDTRFRIVWEIVRWPVSVVLVTIFLAVLYYLGPNVAQSFRWISPGSIIASLTWFLTLLAIKLYLLVADPGLTYGAFSGVILLMLVLYLTAIAIVFGVEINAVLERRYDPLTVRDLAHHPEKLDRPDDVVEAEQHAAAYRRREG
jgi:membrane protein